MIETVLAARWLMGLSLAFHIVYATFGIGLPWLLLYVEARGLRRGDAVALRLARRWSKGFALLFAVGAVSGTVLSFELGLLWPRFMERYGAVIGLPFTLESFAFFVEAIFLGLYLYGWDRLPPWGHWACGIPIALSGTASAVFVTTVNAWMNTPAGFDTAGGAGGAVVAVRPLEVMTSPAAGAQVTHMLLAALVATGWCVAGVYAVGLLRRPGSAYARLGLRVGLALAVVTTPFQIAAGDWAARVVADSQPVKLAALEGQFESERGAPLRIGGIPDEEAGETRYALEIPYGLSLLAYRDPDARVQGLEETPRADWPPVLPVHLSFQGMVGIGTGLLALSLWTAWSALRRRAEPEGRLYLAGVAAAGPASIVAIWLGWLVTELGRQPWIVQGHMRVAEASTESAGVDVALVATVLLYTGLSAVAVWMLRRLAAAEEP